MNLGQSLYEGQQVCLAPIDHEKDPEVMARWTNDAYYLRMLSVDPARPLSAALLKKRLEKIDKDQGDSRSQFYFTLRMRADDRLVGFVHLHWIEWSNGSGNVIVGIGDGKNRRCGYGSEALCLILRFAFAELNLYHLAANIPAYNEIAVHVFQKTGFVEEVRRREAIQRDGQRWDALSLGILREEWERRQA